MRIRYSIVIAILIVIISQDMLSQFISYDYSKPGDAYINYSGRNYENYSQVFLRRKFFDTWGNLLIDGVSIFSLNENQKQFTSSDPGGNSDLVKTRYYSQYFNNLVISNDFYSGFSTRLIVGDAIRTKFTGLTFDKSRFNGTRLDLGTDKYRGSFVLSRVSDPIRMRFDQVDYNATARRRIRDWTQYLFGGHFETDIGDILTVGATYVNQHQRRASVSGNSTSLRGTVTAAIPRVIFVRVQDDSPGDDSGPIIYNTPQIYINGKARPIVNIRRNSPLASTTNLNSPIQYYVFRNFDIDNLMYTGIDTTSYTRYINYAAKFVTDNLPNYPENIKSTETVTYAYIIPEGTQSVSFSVILANDYRVDVAQDWVNSLDDYYKDARWISHTDSLVMGIPTGFRPMVRAEGNVKDGSNRKQVTFNYGLTSGMGVYGMNFKLNWQGIILEGEINQSLAFKQYPLKSGGLFDIGGKAYYLRGSKKIGRFTFGGEIYKIDPNYTTALDIYTLENAYYSYPAGGGTIGYIAPDFLGFDNPNTVPNYLPGHAYYPLVDDNDDKDRWEDGFYFYNVAPSSYQNQDVLNKNYDPFHLGYRQNVNELTSLTDIVRQPDAGIFPGKDKDHDGVPDDDKNLNGVPDFAEDFLTYETDPPSFEFGDDWNNNGVIDAQENDILPDYPYPPDQQGAHIFMGVEATKNLNFNFGIIRENGIAQGGKNKVNYAKITFSTAKPKFGSLDIFYITKRVEDNILNNVYLFQGVVTARNMYPTFTIDPLRYRNSLTNILFIGSKFLQIPNLNIENNIKMESNSQYAIGNPPLDFTTQQTAATGFQTNGTLTSYAFVNKIDYTIRLLDGVLQIKPQFKLRTLKETRIATDLIGGRLVSILNHTQETIPIFRVDYRLTSKTDIHFGLQGFSLFGLSNALVYRIRNLKDNIGDEDRKTFAFTINNRSEHVGYSVVLEAGIKFTSHDYKRDEDKKLYGAEESLIFFSLYAGF